MIAIRYAFLALLAGIVPNAQVELKGWATTYGCPGEEYFHGSPLYCDRGNGLLYDENLPLWWAAVDVSEIESGRVRCGDRVLACTGKGCVTVVIWDAGHLYYDRETGEPWDRLRGRRVVIDLPYHVTMALGWTGMDRVTVMNLSGRERDKR